MPCADLQPDGNDALAEQPPREDPDNVDEARSDEAAGSGSVDDLMVVKRRDALDVAADAAAQHAQADLGDVREGECDSVSRTHSVSVVVTPRSSRPDRVLQTCVLVVHIAY